MRFQRNLAISFLSIVCLGSLALAQQGNPMQANRPMGRALDASLQVGSGGVNYVPRNYSPYSHHLGDITRSRGLTAFQGNAPGLSNQLGLRVRDDGLSTFRQQSVGIGDVLQGPRSIYTPQLQQYNDPLTTTLTPRRVVEQESTRMVPLPSSYQRVDAPSAAAQRELFVDAAADYKPLMSEVSRRYLENTSPPELFPTISPPATAQSALLADSADIATRGGPSYFSLPRMSRQAELARELSQWDEEEQPAPGYLDPRVEGLSEEPEGQRRPLGEEETGEGIARRLEDPTRRIDARVDARSDKPVEVDRRLLDAGVLPGEGQDVFVDLLVTMRRQKQQQGETPEEGQEGMDTGLPEILRGRDTLPEDTEPFVEVRPDRQIVVHRLAGESKDYFNMYMKRGRQALQKGEFFTAARQYELAGMVRPNNALAMIGGALASFGGGEWSAAGYRVHEAFRLFPPLMSVRFDLGELLPADHIQPQLDKLDQWIKDFPEQSTLLMAATFMNANAGNTEQAKAYARRLKDHPRAKPIDEAYAEYILTGELPREAKETTPTGRVAPETSPDEGLETLTDEGTKTAPSEGGIERP